MARIIRSRETAKVIPSVVHDAGTEAKRILEDARSRGARIVSEARREAAEVESEALRKGIAEARAQAAKLLLEADKSHENALVAAEGDATALALAAAKKIIGEELSLSSERIRSIVRNLLERTPRATRVTVRVHPLDAAVLEGDPSFASQSYEVVEDDGITRGGCVVSSSLGETDARIEVQLDALAKALTP